MRYIINIRNNDLVIKCIPDLPENISLDNDNNVLIEIDYSYRFIIKRRVYTLSVR